MEGTMLLYDTVWYGTNYILYSCVECISDCIILVTDDVFRKQPGRTSSVIIPLERGLMNGSFPVVPNVREPGIYTGIREASSTEQKGCNLPLEVIEPRSQSHKEPTKFVWWMRWYGTYTTEGSGALCVCIVYRSSPTSTELF